jgi:hypothetical protein
VDDARLDDLIDNSFALELELAESELVAFRKLKVCVCVMGSISLTVTLQRTR